MFEILIIFGNFWTKNKWYFVEFAALKIPNCLKFHSRFKQINGVVQFVLTNRCSVVQCRGCKIMILNAWFEMI